MKPTDLQKEIIKFCYKQIHALEGSNDIDSPTVRSDMEEGIDSLLYDEKINEVIARDLSGHLNGLLTIIRGLKK